MVGIWKRRWYHQNMGFAVKWYLFHMSWRLKLKHSTVGRSQATTPPNRSYENSAPGTLGLITWIICFVTNVYLSVNDICIHPNQGEVISCDQAGSIKQWDLSDNMCFHELVRFSWMFWQRRLTYWPGFKKTPAGDVPIKSITLAADGSCLVAGNNQVAWCTFSKNVPLYFLTGTVFRLESKWWKFGASAVSGCH